MKKLKRTEQIVIRITPEMKKQVEDLAKKARRSVSDWFRILIEDTIEAHKKNHPTQE